MSSKKYASPLRLEVKPSRFLFSLLLGLHLASTLVLFLLEFDLLMTLCLSLLVFLSAYLLIRKYALLVSSKAIVKIIWDANNEWILETKNGEVIQAILAPESYIHSFMTILIFKYNIEGLHKFLPAYKCCVILLKDNVDASDFRRLRVRLKVGKPIESETL